MSILYSAAVTGSTWRSLLQGVKHATRSNTLDIQRLVIIEGAGDTLTLRCTDYDVELHARATACDDDDPPEILRLEWHSGRQEAWIAVPAAVLHQSAELCGAERVRLEILPGTETTGKRLHITDEPLGGADESSRYSHWSIWGEPLDEQPLRDPPAEIRCPESLHVKAHYLTAALQQVAYASRTADGSPHLHGVHIDWDYERLVAIATDGSRLALATAPIEETTRQPHWLAECGGLQLVQSAERVCLDVLRDSYESVALMPHSGEDGDGYRQAILRTASAAVVAHQPHDVYPDWRSILGALVDVSAEAVLDVTELTHALRIVAPMADEVTQLHIRPADGRDDMLELHTEDPQYGQAVSQVLMEQPADDRRGGLPTAPVRVSLRHLKEALSHIVSTAVRLRLLRLQGYGTATTMLQLTPEPAGPTDTVPRHLMALIQEDTDEPTPTTDGDDA